jgi:II/X family phage/plasmid replication protein
MPIDIGALGTFESQGVVSRTKKGVPAWIKLPGAYAATEMRVRLGEEEGLPYLKLITALFKAGYGHNAIVSRDYDFHMRATVKPLIKRRLKELYPEVDLQWDETRPTKVYRADLVRHYQCGTEELLRAALAEIHLRSVEVGVPGRCKTRGRWPTIGLNEGSEYWEAKFYGKHQELLARGHEIPHRVPNAAEIVELMKHHLRFEVTVYVRQLKAWGLHLLPEWTQPKINQVFDHVLGKLRLDDAGRNLGRFER